MIDDLQNCYKFRAIYLANDRKTLRESQGEFTKEIKLTGDVFVSKNVNSEKSSFFFIYYLILQNY